MLRRLPIGIQEFSEIVEGDYCYVDKTAYCHRLISEGKYYFLSRPRRFGKSLLVNTLKEIFLGNRGLFKGLWIEDKIDWSPRPVIKLDFNEILSRETPLNVSLHQEMDAQAALMGLSPLQGSYDQKFRQLIQQAGSKEQVAILVDEYDKPIIHYIEDEEKAKENREILKSFYSVIKANDRHISFFMLTGVSKFSQVSIFSDLNHLNDISLDEAYSEMLGYTEAEILANFPEHLVHLKERCGDAYPDVLAEMKSWYNGYSWDGLHAVYNPFSILNLFSKGEFGEYWFATGTPTFLMKLIRSRHYGIFDIEGSVVSLRSLKHFDTTQIELHALLFQTGYLTIKKKDRLALTAILDFPNREVANAFSAHMLVEFSEKGEQGTDALLYRMAGHLREAAVSAFMEGLKALFAGIAYPIQPSSTSSIEQHEKYYHSMFYLVLRLLGYDIQSEVLTHQGRIDAAIVTEHFVYVVEFKLDDADAAMAQIKEMGYADRYLGMGKRVFLLGVGFDVHTRNVGNYLVEEV